MRISAALLLTLLTLQNRAYVGRIAKQLALPEAEPGIIDQVTTKIKSGVKRLAKFIPDGGMTASLLDNLTGGGMEEKVDRIEKRQKTSLDRIRAIARQALDTKSKVEELYYFKKNSQEQAEALSRGLQRANKKKFLGTLIEDGIGIPVSPAEYIPNTDQTKKLKENLAIDLSSEKSVINQGKYLLSNTRSALLATNLLHSNPKQFEKAYRQAAAYESTLYSALKAKEIATVRIYKAEIERLEKELQLLEQAKSSKGLTVGDLMQIEMAIDNKRQAIRDLNEKITVGIKDSLELSARAKEQLATHKAQQDAEKLAKYLAEDKQRIKAQYGHLWMF